MVVKRLLSIFLALVFTCLPTLAQTQVASWTEWPTYAVTTGYITPYATPTDVVVIGGSATKTIRIQRITLSSTQTTAGLNNWFLIKRNTADSGGTTTALTTVPLNSNNPTATGTYLLYTAAPTINNTVGTIRAVTIESNAPASTAQGNDYTIFDAQYAGQAITLNGAAQQCALNFAGAAVPTGLSISVTVYTTEY